MIAYVSSGEIGWKKWSKSIVSIFFGKITLALLTSILLVLLFPSPDQGWLAWVALVPLIIACHGLGAMASFNLGLFSGMATAFGIFRWIFEVPGFQVYHALLLALYIGLYTAAWCTGLTFFSRSRLPLIIIGPALWVAIDYLKAHAGFMALPWATLAQSQHRNIVLMQMATITGEYGVTFVVVMSNIALSELITRRAWKSAVVAGLITALVHIGGAVTLYKPSVTRTLRVSVVQPSILIQERRTPEGRAASLERLEELTRDAATKKPALIAWPETAVRDFRKEPGLMERVQKLAKDINTPLVVGASEFVKFSRIKMEEDSTNFSVEEYSYNSAYFITPNGSPEEPYRKVLLLPFGESLPLESFVRWPDWLIPKVFQDLPGDSPKQFKLTEDICFTVRICWEGVFADFLRRSVREGGHFLVQMNNANWFGRTAAEPQHNLSSIYRAVENRIPVAVASNTGPSLIIDPYGHILSKISDFFVPGTATADVPLGNGLTFYTKFGDVFAFASMAFVLLGWIVPLLDKRKKKRR